MKKGVFIFLCSLVLLSFVCAIPPTLVGEKEHVSSAKLGDRVLISYNFDKLGEEVLERQGVDVFLIIDSSSSMNGDRIKDAKIAAKSFIDGLDNSTDRVGLGVIGSERNNRVVLNLTNDFEMVNSQIDSLRSGGNTYGSNVVNQSFQFLKNNGRENALKVIFLFTDGDFTSEKVQKNLINSTIYSSSSIGIKTYTSFFGTKNSASNFLKSLAEVGNGEYFDSPTGEDLKNSFLKVLNIIKKNVASDFILNDSFFSGVEILEEGFPSDCEKFLVGGNFSVSCKRNSLFSLESAPFNFSFFVNVTSVVDKLSKGTFVSYKNYSGKESVIFLSDKNFQTIDNSVPFVDSINCSLISGAFCSPSIENAKMNESYFCDVPGEFCYSCNEGFYFDSSIKKCLEQKQSCEDLGGYCSPIVLVNGVIQSNGLCAQDYSCYFCREDFSFDDSKSCVSSNEVQFVCERGLGFSYWKKLGGEEELWIYSSSDSDLIGDAKCNQYGNSFCCPEYSSCNSRGECVFEDNFLEYCSSLVDESSCTFAPDWYAKDEISSLRGNSFLETTCSNSWYESSSATDCDLRSSCNCFWNSSLNKCLSRERIENSCSSGDVNYGLGSCLYEKIVEENNCDSTGYYSREIIAIVSGDYPNLEDCVNVSQEIKCPTNSLSLPFFGIFNFFIVLVVVFLASFWLVK